MRKLLAFALILSVAGAAMAFDLSNEAPRKAESNVVYNPPAEVRQGGNTVAEAVAINIPGTWNGTTVGYTNNYDEACPYTGSTSPDVVYSITPAAATVVDIDLCYSSYDTKLYVYDANMNVVGCNDDAHFSAPCFTYSSKLEGLPLAAGMTYFVIVDGYGGSAGAYQMDITEFEPCIITCPAGAQLEGEPPLVNGYLDAHNGGCNSPEFGNPFQPLTGSVFCGVSGWFIGSSGAETRDTDWFTIEVPAIGFFEVVGDAEYPTYMFELAPTNCASVDVVQDVVIGPCNEGTMTIAGAPGSTIWFWVGPTTFTGPVNEYNYVLYTNLIVSTEAHSLTGVKSLFR